MTGTTLRHLVLLGMMLGLAHAGYAAVPAGFSDTLVTNVGSPTALAFTPDGRLLITTQGGTLRVWAGTLLPNPALTLSVCAGSERGLLGVAVDPGFATNRRIYLFYTANTCVNRVSRFTFFSIPGQENQVDPDSELILVNNMPSPAGNHNAGDLHIGKDGYLYISIGDGGCDYAGGGCGGSNDASRDQHELTGKILRITLDGGIPPDNPFQGAGTARCNVTGGTTAGTKCQETFAWGFRNPFRFAMDPNAAGTRLFVNDVGQGAWEEIDAVQAGADYGWNCREGAHVNSTSGPCNPTPAGMVDPIYEYPHGTPGPAGINNCNSITGGAFVPNGLWPGFDGSYLFSDFICGAVFKLTQAGTWSATSFASGLGGSSAVHMAFGPWGTTQALYYTTYADNGQVRRISRRVARPGGPLDYYTVAPCRVVDTRSAAGLQGGPALAAGTTRTFQMAGLCGIPSTASAVQLNVAVASPSAAGFLRIEPGDEAASSTSILNFTAGANRANNAISFLGTAGDLAFTLSNGTAHVVVDVMGYFQ
jgi:glucose/arabinose dehydrogenase